MYLVNPVVNVRACVDVCVRACVCLMLGVCMLS